jgi:DNA-binding response OmpR family regulator
LLAEEKVLDVLAYKLHKKLEASNSKCLLDTVSWGRGYVLREQK